MAPSIGYDDMLTALRTTLDHTVDLAGSTDANLHIPTCPEWQARDLWQHLGMVQRFWTAIIVTRSQTPIRRESIEGHEPTDDHWGPWMADGARELLAAFDGATADEPVWTWADDHTIGWCLRRQLHEALIHTADVTLARDERVDIAPGVAIDSVDELLDIAQLRLRHREDPLPTGIVHLHATDVAGDGGEWTITMGPGGIHYDHTHDKGDVAVRAPVDGLLLAAYGRSGLDPATAEVFGDRSRWDDLVDLLAFG